MLPESNGTDRTLLSTFLVAGLPLTAFHGVWEVGDRGDEGSGPGCRQDRGNGTCMDPVFLKHRFFQARHAFSLSLLAVDVLSSH